MCDVFFIFYCSAGISVALVLKRGDSDSTVNESNKVMELQGFRKLWRRIVGLTRDPDKKKMQIRA